jgi:hypothetical protein
MQIEVWRALTGEVISKGKSQKEGAPDPVQDKKSAHRSILETNASTLRQIAICIGASIVRPSGYADCSREMRLQLRASQKSNGT